MLMIFRILRSLGYFIYIILFNILRLRYSLPLCVCEAPHFHLVCHYANDILDLDSSTINSDKSSFRLHIRHVLLIGSDSAISNVEIIPTSILLDMLPSVLGLQEHIYLAFRSYSIIPNEFPSVSSHIAKYPIPPGMAILGCTTLPPSVEIFLE